MAQLGILTKRETQIAEMIAWGAAKKEIADMLHISESTVGNTARNIYDKLGIQKATELSAWYFCTRFHISISMSPIKRSIVAMLLIILIIPSDIFGVRSFRSSCRRQVERRMGRRKADGADGLTFECSLD
jgi:DNA-binding CsgD family transcriptional regulator